MSRPVLSSGRTSGRPRRSPRTGSTTRSSTAKRSTSSSATTTTRLAGDRRSTSSRILGPPPSFSMASRGRSSTQGLARPEAERDSGLAGWRASLGSYDLDRVVDDHRRLRRSDSRRPQFSTRPAVRVRQSDAEYPASLIYQTVAHDELPGSGHDDYGDPAEIAAACINLAIITGNLGRPGGGVASPRGPANYQGVTDMGAHPARLPGGFDAQDAEARLRFEAAWMPHWGDRATTGNGFVPVRHLPSLGRFEPRASCLRRSKPDA